jgi:lysophospholipase L1-like esterase
LSRGSIPAVSVADQVSSYVALGDSFTEGLEDELDAGGRHRGWADRVATALAVHHGRLQYANLAVRGRLLDQTIAEQIPVALALAPSLISFHAGPNDVLRPRVELPALLDRYDAAVVELRSGGAQVLLFTVAGPPGSTSRTAQALTRRFTVFNRRVRQVAAREHCLLVDLGAVPVLWDRRLWHEDRLHLSPEGHARVAAAVLEELGLTDPALLGGPAGWWRQPLPARTDTGLAARRADLGSDVRWFRRHLVPWVGRRLRGVSSGDGIVSKQVELVELRAPS